MGFNWRQRREHFVFFLLLICIPVFYLIMCCPLSLVFVLVNVLKLSNRLQITCWSSIEKFGPNGDFLLEFWNNYSEIQLGTRQLREMFSCIFQSLKLRNITLKLRNNSLKLRNSDLNHATIPSVYLCPLFTDKELFNAYSLSYRHLEINKERTNDE